MTPAASGSIGALAGCTSPWYAFGLRDPAIDARHRLEQSVSRSPIRRRRRDEWASIEHDVMDQAPRNWRADRPTNRVFQRLGNFQEVSQQWGPLVDQMWVQ